MTTLLFNPLAGKNSTCSRFRFRVRSIAHKSLYLPVEMKALSQIRQLIDGVPPLVVFRCDDIKAARRAFYDLRKKFDFPYWAALEYTIPENGNYSKMIPLILNRIQRHIVEIFIGRTNAGLPGRYIISKSVPGCGLTTCVQAYILWRQLYWHPHHSITCTHSNDMMDKLKSIVSRSMSNKEDIRNLVLINEGVYSFFQSVYYPNVLDGCSSSYVHLADMSKWQDLTSEISDHVYSNAMARWNDTPSSLMVLEGDCPSHPEFHMENHRNYYLQETVRLMQLEAFTSNPFFLNRLVIASDRKVTSDLYHLDLDLIPG